MIRNSDSIETEREQGGIEYAVMRISDGALLWDDDFNGVYQSWEDDEENASWVGSKDDAMSLADYAGLVTDDGLAQGYEITERPWYYEDDLEEDDFEEDE